MMRQPPAAVPAELVTAVAAHAEAALGEAYKITDKQARYARVGEIKKATIEALAGGESPKFEARKVNDQLGMLEYNLVRRRILAGLVGAVLCCVIWFVATIFI